MSYDDICAKVLPLDAKRDEEAFACGGMKAAGKIGEEVNAKLKAALEASELKAKEKELDSDEVKSMQRRRSSLMQLQDQLNSLRMSARNLEEVREDGE